MIVTQSVTELIGQTPIIQLKHLTGPDDASIYGKLESLNIGGSVKDRTVKYLIEYAESSGVLTRDKTIIEATSGNTGVATAMLAASKGYDALIIMSESASVERRKLIQAYGADLLLTDGNLGTGGAIDKKKELVNNQPDKYVDLSQFKNPVNVMAHYQTTGREILDQLDGQLDLFIVGIGTAGTGVGISRRLKQHDPSIKVIGVTPCVDVNLPGLRNPCSSNGTRLFHEASFDEVIYIEHQDIEPIIQVARKTAENTGLLLGFSGAANLYYATMFAKRRGPEYRIVTILPDGGERYLSTSLYGVTLPSQRG